MNARPTVGFGSFRVCRSRDPHQKGRRDPRRVTEREAAWWALHDALPPGWRLGELTFDPATEEYVLSARLHGAPAR